MLGTTKVWGGLCLVLLSYVCAQQVAMLLCYVGTSVDNSFK